MTRSFLNKCMMLVAVAAFAPPALAQSATLSVVGQYGVGAVHDDSEIAMAPLPGGKKNFNYAGNPTWFDDKLFCVSGRDDNWSIRKNGTIDDSPRNPARRPICTPLVNGRAQLTHPFGRNVDAFIADSAKIRILAWASDDSLTPNYHN